MNGRYTIGLVLLEKGQLAQLIALRDSLKAGAAK